MIAKKQREREREKDWGPSRSCPGDLLLPTRPCLLKFSPLPKSWDPSLQHMSLGRTFQSQTITGAHSKASESQQKEFEGFTCTWLMLFPAEPSLPGMTTMPFLSLSVITRKPQVAVLLGETEAQRCWRACDSSHRLAPIEKVGQSASLGLPEAQAARTLPSSFFRAQGLTCTCVLDSAWPWGCLCIRSCPGSAKKRLRLGSSLKLM